METLETFIINAILYLSVGLVICIILRFALLKYVFKHWLDIARQFEAKNETRVASTIYKFINNTSIVRTAINPTTSIYLLIKNFYFQVNESAKQSRSANNES